MYFGLTGAEFEISDFDFGHGVRIEATYAHIMAHYMLACNPPPEPGAHHPAPWIPAGSSHTFDVSVQLTIPEPMASTYLGGLLPAFWITKLLRLKSTPLLQLAVTTTAPFSEIAAPQGPFGVRLLETTERRLAETLSESAAVSAAALEWTRDNWFESRGLTQNRSFGLAQETLDRCVEVHNRPLATLYLWGALEALFAPARAELKFRISSAIACYLEPPGVGRHEMQKRVSKLYDVRSAIAHGDKPKRGDKLEETYALLRRCITKVIEERHVPTRDELEERLFRSA